MFLDYIRNKQVKIQYVRIAIVLVHKKIIGDFYLTDNIMLELDTGNVKNLGLKNVKNVSDLVGKLLNYRTANPAKKELKILIT